MSTRTLEIPSPNPRQRLAMECRTKYIIFGGARGGGKSWMVRTKAKLLALRYPGIKILIVRSTYPELTENHINPLKMELKSTWRKEDRIAAYNQTEHKFTFSNGSTIHLSYCARDDDLGHFQGHEYDIIFIDEATKQTEYQIKGIAACMRGVNDFPKRMYLTCNPGGKGYQYIKRLKDREFMNNERPEDYTFIQSLVTDNTALMQSNPDYIHQLEALPPKLREAWLHGNWDIYEGQFFEEFRDDPDHYDDRRNTHVIRGFAPKAGWKIYRSFDWGYGKPFSAAWWAVDFDGVVYRILELYGCRKDESGLDIPNEGVKWTDDKIFSEIGRMEREHPWLAGKQISGPADNSIFDGEETGLSHADTARKYGIHYDRSNKERIPGWMQMHYRLAFDENGFPMMYIFDNCKAFIRTIPTLVYDEHRDEDLDTDGEDHVADETRYFLMSHPITPRENKVVYVPETDPLNQFQHRRT